MTLEELRPEALSERVRADLERSANWPVVAEDAGIRVSWGFLPDLPCRAYRTDLELPAPPDAVARLLADEMFERLGDWNREFVRGEIVDVLEANAGRRAWLMRALYRTPPPLGNREYLYYLAREDASDGSALISYRSVDADVPVEAGYVRGTLFPTVHHCAPVSGGTRLRHILANDIGGRIPQWVQNHVFARGFVAANLRDAQRQRALFG